MLQSSKLVLQAMQKPNILQQESSKNIGENYRRNKYYKDASNIDHLQTGTYLYTYIYTRVWFEINCTRIQWIVIVNSSIILC